jgi:hypothetical protein
VYLLNRSSSKSIGGKTPYELWTGSAPGVHHLRTFGSIAHVKVTSPNSKKLVDRNRCMIFVGYEAGSKAYRVYDPSTRRVHISRDVVFDEGAQWAWPADHDGGDTDFTIAESTAEEPTVITTTSARVARASSEPAASGSTSPSSPGMSTSPFAPAHTVGIN